MRYIENLTPEEVEVSSKARILLHISFMMQRPKHWKWCIRGIGRELVLIFVKGNRELP